MKTMNKVVLAGAILFSSQCYGQQPNRHRLYSPYYNGYGMQPGLSTYGNGYYSKDYYSGRQWYHYGYRPARSGRSRKIYNNSYMYNPYSENPYDPASPVWGW